MCLGLVYLTNTTPSTSRKTGAAFWAILFRGPCLLLHHPYDEPLFWFMIDTLLQQILTLFRLMWKEHSMHATMIQKKCWTTYIPIVEIYTFRLSTTKNWEFAYRRNLSVQLQSKDKLECLIYMQLLSHEHVFINTYILYLLD